MNRPVHIGCSGWQYKDWREALTVSTKSAGVSCTHFATAAGFASR